MLANAATAFGARADAAVAVRDGDAIDALVAPRAEIRDHKTGTTFGREERLSGFRALLSEARDPVSRHEPLAALGSSLALLHRTLSASGFGGETQSPAAYRIEELCVVEADPEGRCTRVDLFAVDRLGEAIARLYERYAERLPKGALHTRAAAIARSVATVLGPPDPDLVRPALALDVRYADHRALGWGPANGVLAFVRALRTLRNALPEVEADTIELLALRADALLVRRTIAGELSVGHDRYRRRPIVLWAFGAGGRVTHWEQFDGDQRELALARFDELAKAPALPRIVETMATAALDRLARGQRDPQELLATRGERLALIRVHSRFEGSDRELGPSETESLMVIEVDARGDRVARVRFDADSLTAAHAELDARYAAGEATEHGAMWAALWDVRRAFAARNWDRLTTLVSADLVAEDHRLLGWGIARSPEQYAAVIRPLTELRADVSLRLDHLLLRDRTALFVASWTGGGAEGAFEIPVVIVFRAGTDGRIDRVYHYSLEQIGAARAQLEKLSAPSDAAQEAAFPHVATTSRAFRDAFARRDWDALAALVAPDLLVDDHRVLGWETVHGAQAYVQTLHSLVDLAPDTALRLDHAETSQRGLLWIGAWVGTRDGGAFETPWITVSEHDARGAVVRLDQYDPDQLADARARFAELAGSAPKRPGAPYGALGVK